MLTILTTNRPRLLRQVAQRITGRGAPGAGVTLVGASGCGASVRAQAMHAHHRFMHRLHHSVTESRKPHRGQTRKRALKISWTPRQSASDLSIPRSEYFKEDHPNGNIPFVPARSCSTPFTPLVSSVSPGGVFPPGGPAPCKPRACLLEHANRGYPERVLSQRTTDDRRV